jgi:tetratricopeptide (TPR) repeat protein
MIVRDAEATLPACLGSVAGIPDETVVVDTGSTDRTKELAAALGARVLEFAWRDDFAAARNESLRHATRERILWLDADEWLDEINRRRLEDLVSSLPAGEVAGAMTQRSRLPADDAIVRVRQVRLFPNRPDIRWRYRVHEQILPALDSAGTQLLSADVVIEHGGYQESEAVRRKDERNLHLLELDYADCPHDYHTLYHLGCAYVSSGRAARGLPLLERGLANAPPESTIVPRLYQAIAGVQFSLGRPGMALATCREGRGRCPYDADLLFLQGALLAEYGDAGSAEQCFRELLDEPSRGPSAVSALPGCPIEVVGRLPAALALESVEEGLFSYKSRNELAWLCLHQGRAAEAEAHWRLALADYPGWGPALHGLGELGRAMGDASHSGQGELLRNVSKAAPFRL